MGARVLKKIEVHHQALMVFRGKMRSGGLDMGLAEGQPQPLHALRRWMGIQGFDLEAGVDGDWLVYPRTDPKSGAFQGGQVRSLVQGESLAGMGLESGQGFAIGKALRATGGDIYMSIVPKAECARAFGLRLKIGDDPVLQEMSGLLKGGAKIIRCDFRIEDDRLVATSMKILGVIPKKPKKTRKGSGNAKTPQKIRRKVTRKVTPLGSDGSSSTSCSGQGHGSNWRRTSYSPPRRVDRSGPQR